LRVGPALRLLAAPAAGGLLYLSFPPRPLWWLAPVAFALLTAVLYGRRCWAGFGYGYLFGLGFLLPLLWWIGYDVGSAFPVLLCAAEAVFCGLACAGATLVLRLPGGPFWAAGLWVAGEAARARVPFEGFPWGKVAFGQPDGVFLPLAAVGGTPLLSYAVALCGFGLGMLVIQARARRTAGLITAATAALLPVVAGLAATPLVTAAGGGDRTAAGGQRQITVAAVQGNVPRLGLDFNAQRRAVLDNHARRTAELADGVAAGTVPRPDVVIWPENAADIDPVVNADARALVTGVVDRLGVPVLVGGLRYPAPGVLYNAVIAWTPGGGPGPEYHKRHLQPFGEYLPLRTIAAALSPAADRVSTDMSAGGRGEGVLELGTAPVGIATCYEIAFDDIVRDTVRDGAQLLAVPSNNATFGLTEMTYQQLAMSRVRAVEHDRTVVVAATSGASAIIAPDGSVLARSGQFVPDALVARVPLRETATLATRIGPAPEWLLAGLGLAAVAVAMIQGRRARRAVPDAGSGAGSEDEDG
jgi:apolipoprotein N-acyltransferase